ncbi:hypothetical protein B2A_11063, partial [mine drainage metagenome]
RTDVERIAPRSAPHPAVGERPPQGRATRRSGFRARRSSRPRPRAGTTRPPHPLARVSAPAFRSPETDASPSGPAKRTRCGRRASRRGGPVRRLRKRNLLGPVRSGVADVPEWPIESRRLARFAAAAGSGAGPPPIARWNGFAARGLPLVEPIPGDPTRVRVTFAWRPEQRVRSPSIYCPALNPWGGESTLLPVGRTGMWYRSVVLPRDARALYGFSPIPMPDGGSEADWAVYSRSLVADPWNPDRLAFARDPRRLRGCRRHRRGPLA